MADLLKLGPKNRKDTAQAAILEALVKGEVRGFNEIQRDTDLSPRIISKYLREFTNLRRSFVIRRDDGKYQITRKGIEYLYTLRDMMERFRLRETREESIIPFACTNMTGQVYIALVKGAPTLSYLTEQKVKEKILEASNDFLTAITNVIPGKNVQGITFNAYFRKEETRNQC